MQSAAIRQTLVWFILAAMAVGVLYGIARMRGQPLVAGGGDVPARPAEPELVPARSGPWPKAVASLKSIEFGNVVEGQSQERPIRITNEGAAPLVIKSGNLTCECELRGIPSAPVPAGESVELTLIWSPRANSEQFSLGIAVRTNDPQNREIFFPVHGRVLPMFNAFPKEDWSVDVVREDGPTELFGIVFSQVQPDFRIERVEVGDAPIDVEVRRITDRGRELQAGQQDGWEISLWIRPEMPVGKFRFPVALVTDLAPVDSSGHPGATEIPIHVAGRRRGPFRMIGKGWYDDKLTMSLGVFPAASGRTMKWLLLCEDLSVDDLRIEEILCDVDAVEFQVARDQNFKGRGAKFNLEVKYPPGGPILSRQLDNAATVRVRTNHPVYKELVYRLDFNAT